LGIDVQRLEYFVSKKIIEDNNNEELDLGVENMREEVGEEYPKHIGSNRVRM
jgi:hypothetical protein